MRAVVQTTGVRRLRHPQPRAGRAAQGSRRRRHRRIGAGRSARERTGSGRVPEIPAHAVSLQHKLPRLRDARRAHRRVVDGEPVLHRHVFPGVPRDGEGAATSSAWQLQQVLTAYMVPFAFASLVHGPLSDAVGRRPVMIWGMVLYTVGSVACTFAPNYELLIASRVLQGATAGVGVVIGRAIIRDLYEGAARAAPHEPHHDDLQRSRRRSRRSSAAGCTSRSAGARCSPSWWSAASSSRLPRGGGCRRHIRRRPRIPFNARNLVSTSWTVLRHREFLMLALAAAINFCSIACFIGSAPDDHREALGHERDVVLPRCSCR